VLDALVDAAPRPHHPLLVGAVIGIDGGSPADAAHCAAYLAVSGPASAAVRLLGLDPFAVNAAVVALRPVLDAVVAEAAVPRPANRLPAPGAPVLDLMAQAHVHHHREQVRLFVS
jgi:urease accessory protein